MGQQDGLTKPEYIRSPDWRQRFENVIDEIRYVPFSWGDHDCGPSFVGRIVFAVTGQTIPEFVQYEGAYSDEESAIACMKAAGFSNLGDLLAASLPEIHPSQAKMGDIIAYQLPKSELGYALGVVNGERCFTLRVDGLGSVDLLSCARAFKVG